nr:hypothetical protein [Dendronalium sp. ChiSLP03b]MDZ8209296.1 hypothetical protein [Dendronalium sp. ChiSLP03b]
MLRLSRYNSQVTARDRENTAEKNDPVLSTMDNSDFDELWLFAVEQGNILGRAIAESSFHHFADYNWDVDMGAPSFVTEPPGDGMKQNPQALEHIKAYVRNLALWLAPTSS